MPVPVTFTAAVQFDNHVIVAFSEEVQQTGGGTPDASDFLVSVTGYVSVTVTVSTTDNTNFQLSIDLGGNDLPQGGEAVTVTLSSGEALENKAGNKAVALPAQALDAGVLRQQVSVQSSSASGNTATFTFSGAVRPAMGGSSLNASQFETSVLAGAQPVPHTVIVREDGTQSNTYIVSIDPVADAIAGTETFSVNLLEGAIEASSGVPVAPLDTAVTGTMAPRVGFTAAIDDQNRFVVTFDQEVSESGGSLSPASFNLTQLPSSQPQGTELVPPAVLSGIKARQSVSDTKVYNVEVLTATAPSGLENVAINIVAGVITGADGIPLRPKASPVIAQLSAEVVPSFSIDDGNVITVTFAGGMVQSSSVQAMDVVAEVNSTSGATLTDRLLQVVKAGEQYEVELSVSGVITQGDTVAANLVLASVTDSVGRLVRPLAAPVLLPLAPTTTFSAAASDRLLEFIVSFSKNVSSSRNPGQSLQWSDFQATVEQRGSNALLEFELAAVPGGSLIQDDTFVVQVSVPSGVRTGDELITFNIMRDSMQDSSGVTVPPLDNDIELQLMKPTAFSAFHAPGNKIAVNFSRPVVIDDKNDFVLRLINSPSVSVADWSAAAAPGAMTGAAPGSADEWILTVDYSGTLNGSEIVTVQLASMAVDDPIGGFVNPSATPTQVQLQAPTTATLLVQPANTVLVTFTAPVTATGGGSLTATHFNVSVSFGTATLNSFSVSAVTADGVKAGTQWVIELDFGDTRLDGSEELMANLLSDAAYDAAGQAVVPPVESVSGILNAPAVAMFSPTTDSSAVIVRFDRDVTSADFGVLSAAAFNASLEDGVATLRDYVVEKVGNSGSEFSVTPRLSGIPDGEEVFKLNLLEGAVRDSLGFFVYPLEEDFAMSIPAQDTFAMTIERNNGIRLQFAGPVYTQNTDHLTQDSLQVTVTGGTLLMPEDRTANPILITDLGMGLYELDIPFIGYSNGSDVVTLSLLSGSAFYASDDQAVPAVTKSGRLYAPTRFSVAVNADNSGAITFDRAVLSGLTLGGPVDEDAIVVHVKDTVSGVLFNVTNVGVAEMSETGAEPGSKWHITYDFDRRATSQYQLHVRMVEMAVFDSRNVSVPVAPLVDDPALNSEATYRGSVTGHNEVLLSFSNVIRSTQGRALQPFDFELEIRNISSGSTLLSQPDFDVEHLSTSLNRVSLVPDITGFPTGYEQYAVNIKEGAIEDAQGLRVSPDTAPQLLQLRAQPQLEVSLNLRNEVIFAFTERVTNEMTSAALSASDFNISVSEGSATLSDFSVVVLDEDENEAGGARYAIVLSLDGTIDGSETVHANLIIGSQAVSAATGLEAEFLMTPFTASLLVVTQVSFTIDTGRVVTVMFDGPVTALDGSPLDATNFDVDATGNNFAQVTVAVAEVPGSSGARWTITPTLPVAVLQGDQLSVNLVEGTVKDGRGVGVPASSQAAMLDLTPTVTMSLELKGDNSIHAVFSGPVRRSADQASELLAADFEVAVTGGVPSTGFEVEKVTDSEYKLTILLSAPSTQEQVTVAVAAGAVEDASGNPVIPKEDFRTLARQPTVAISLTVDNDVLYDFGTAMYAVPGPGYPSDDCFEVTVTGGVADTASVTVTVANSQLDSSDYLASLSFEGGALPDGTETVTANLKGSCIGTFNGLAVRPLDTDFNGTLTAPTVLQSIEIESSGHVLFTLSATASRPQGAGSDLEAFSTVLSSSTGRILSRQLEVVSPTQRRVKITYGGAIKEGDAIAASLADRIAPLYDERGAAVVPLPAPIMLSVEPTTTHTATMGPDNAITVDFSRAIAKASGGTLDASDFQLTVSAPAVFGPGGRSEPVAALDSFEVSPTAGTPDGTSFLLTPTFTNPSTGIETASLRLASDSGVVDDRGMNVPRLSAPIAFNLTRDPVLDEEFDGEVAFPEEQVVDLLEDRLRLRWLAPQGLDSAYVWLQLEVRSDSESQPLDYAAIAVSPTANMLGAGRSRAIVAIANRSTPLLFDLVDQGGKTAVETTQAAQSPLQTGQWYVGPPKQGTQAADEGYDYIMLVKRAITPPDERADGEPLQLADGAETTFIFAAGQETTPGSKQLQYHSSELRGDVAIQLVPQLECTARSTCSGNGQCALDVAIAANVSTEALPERLACLCDFGFAGARCDECMVGFEAVPPVADEPLMCLFPDVSSGVDFGDDDGAPVGIATIVFELRLMLDYTTIMQDEAGFTSDFKRDTGAALGLSPDRILVRALREGSVIVDFAVTPSRNDTQEEYESIAEALFAQVLDPSSALRTGGAIGAAVDPSSIRVAEVIAPVPPTGLPTLENNEFRHRADLGPDMQIRWFLSDAEQPSSENAATARRTPAVAGETYLHARVTWRGEGEVPWFGVGFNTEGEGMIGSHAAVAWPGQLTSGTKIREYILTAKEGYPNGVEPKQPAGDLLVVDVRERRDKEGQWIMEFSRVMKPGAGNSTTIDLPSSEDEGALHMVWAYGAEGERDIQATSSGHSTNRGALRIDLSSGNIEIIPVSSLKKVHAILMGISWGILIPLGVFLIKFVDKDEARFGVVAFTFQVHRVVNTLAVVLSIVGLSLAFAAVEGPHFNYSHGVLGIITFGMGVVQPINALLRPPAPASKTADKTVLRMMWEVLHKSLGYFAMLFGFITILTGTVIISDQGGESGTAATAVGVCIILLVLAFVGAAGYQAVRSEPESDAELEEMAAAEVEENGAESAAKQLRHTLGKEQTMRSEQAAAAAVMARSRAGNLETAAGHNPLSRTKTKQKAMSRMDSMYISPPDDEPPSDDSGDDEAAKSGGELEEPVKSGGGGLTDSPRIATAAASGDEDHSSGDGKSLVNPLQG